MHDTGVMLARSCQETQFRILHPHAQGMGVLRCNSTSLILHATRATGGSCAEFLVHGVDVEGKQLGVDEALVRLLGAASPLPVTYAGGVRTLARA